MDINILLKSLENKKESFISLKESLWLRYQKECFRKFNKTKWIWKFLGWYREKFIEIFENIIRSSVVNFNRIGIESFEYWIVYILNSYFTIIKC